MTRGRQWSHKSLFKGLCCENHAPYDHGPPLAFRDLCMGKGAPGTVPLHNLGVSPYVLHQDVHGSKYVSFEIFGAFLGAKGGAPGTVPLQNPQVTSRKACLRNADSSSDVVSHLLLGEIFRTVFSSENDKRPGQQGFKKSAKIGHTSSVPP